MEETKNALDQEILKHAKAGSEICGHCIANGHDFTLPEKWQWTNKMYDKARLYSDFQTCHRNKCDTPQKREDLEKAFASIWPTRAEADIHIAAALKATFQSGSTIITK